MGTKSVVSLIAVAITLFTCTPSFAGETNAEAESWQMKEKCRRMNEGYIAPDERAKREMEIESAEKSNQESYLRINGKPSPPRASQATLELKACNKIFQQAKYSFFDNKDAEAAQLFGQAAEMMAKIKGPESIEVENILYRQALSFAEAGKPGEGAEVFERALAMSDRNNRLAECDFSEAVETSGSVVKTHWLDHLGNCYFKMKDFSRMASTYARMLKIPQKERGQWPDERVWRELAHAYDGQEKYKEAIPYWEKFLAAVEKPEDREAIDKVHKLRFQRTGPDIYYLPGEVQVVARASSSLAHDYLKIGEVSKAEPLYARVANIFNNWYTATEWDEEIPVLEEYSTLLRQKTEMQKADQLEKKLKELKTNGKDAAAKLTQQRADQMKAYEVAEAEEYCNSITLLYAKNDIAEATILKPSLFEGRHPKSSTAVTREMITRVNDINGLESGRLIRAGEILREADLRLPTVAMKVVCATSQLKKGAVIKDAALEDRRVEYTNAEKIIGAPSGANGFRATSDITAGKIIFRDDLARTSVMRADKAMEPGALLRKADYHEEFIPSKDLNNVQVNMINAVAAHGIGQNTTFGKVDLVERHSCYPVAANAMKKGAIVTITDLKWLKGKREQQYSEPDALPYDEARKLMVMKDIPKGATINGAIDISIALPLILTEDLYARIKQRASTEKKSDQQVMQELVNSAFGSEPIRWLRSRYCNPLITSNNRAGFVLDRPAGNKGVEIWLPNEQVHKLEELIHTANLYGSSEQDLVSHMVSLFMGPFGTVVCTTKDVAEGAVLNANVLKERKLPISLIVPEEKKCSSIKVVAGKKCGRSIEAGQPIWSSDIGVP